MEALAGNRTYRRLNVVPDIEIPGYESALALERKSRCIAILGLPQTICGVRVESLTPWRLEWLREKDNPFIVGGMISVAHMLQFLWLVATDSGEAMQMDSFIERHATLNAIELREGIDSYLNNAFMDSPQGKSGTPYYAPTISYYHSLVIAYPGGGWTLDKVSDTPIPVILQLIKADAHYNGRVVYNGISDRVAGDWLDEQNSPEKIAERLAEQKRMFVEHFNPRVEAEPEFDI